MTCYVNSERTKVARVRQWNPVVDHPAVVEVATNSNDMEFVLVQKEGMSLARINPGDWIVDVFVRGPQHGPSESFVWYGEWDATRAGFPDLVPLPWEPFDAGRMSTRDYCYWIWSPTSTNLSRRLYHWSGLSFYEPSPSDCAESLEKSETNQVLLVARAEPPKQPF